MSSIERGKNGVSVDLFGEMATVLKCSVEYLAYGVDSIRTGKESDYGNEYIDDMY